MNFIRMILVCWTAIVTCPIGTAAADTDSWTLESVTQRVLAIAPERRQAETAVEARQEELRQAGSWPNPSMDLRADDRVAQMSGQGGTNLSQFALSQPLPFRRLARQRAAAESGLEAERASQRAQLLMLERDTARVYLAVQLASAKRQLAIERMSVTSSYLGRPTPVDSGHLRRYLTPLERLRIAMLAEDARQQSIMAEREYESARIEFLNLLGLASRETIEVLPLEPSVEPHDLKTLEQQLDTHPLIEAASHNMEATEEGVAVAHSKRFADPTLTLFRERDYANHNVNITGVGISIELPLWSQNLAMEDKAKAEAENSRARLDAVRRDAHTRLEQAYAQLVRLRGQSEQLHTNLVEPARNVLELTRRSFSSGEINVLALVDANNSYFDARIRYLELLQATAQAAADLRLAAGISIVPSKEYQP